ncbi:hypothetical protein LINGRAHAP2_LOCUS18654 [Linum grandiflorum]
MVRSAKTGVGLLRVCYAALVVRLWWLILRILDVALLQEMRSEELSIVAGMEIEWDVDIRKLAILSNSSCAIQILSSSNIGDNGNGSLSNDTFLPSKVS